MAVRGFHLYRSLPFQLFLLHFRKYQLLLVFWFILFATISGHYGSTFGAASLFLAPEYLGKTSILSFLLLGGAVAIFTMSWHITTFIIHSKRVPFLGATRHAFVKYCLNNSLIPLLFIITYIVIASQHLYRDEHYSGETIVIMLFGFLLGFSLILSLSFLYFFRVDKNILKSVLSSIGYLTAIRGIIPYDSLDEDYEEIYVENYLDSFFCVKKVKRPYQYNLRFLTLVLRRHHRNAIFVIILAYVLLLITGIFMDKPAFRIPAGSGFLILFSIIMAFVGSFKYFLRSWEVIGWITLFVILSLLTKKGVFDLRSVAYGLNYTQPTKPDYNNATLKAVFDSTAIQHDRQQEKTRLSLWKQKQHQTKPAIVVISASGGGSRSAYWTFRCLQYADSLTGGALFKHTVLLTGASGGMIGLAYWQRVHAAGEKGQIKNVYNPAFQQNIGKDLLNAIVSSMAAVDFISPLHKVTVNHHRYRKDRGFAFDQELGSITSGLMDKTLAEIKPLVAAGKSPMMVINSSIINDGRKLMISSQPISYLTRANHMAYGHQPVIDAVGFQRFFKKDEPLDIKLTTALRMGATFPIILPIVKLPSRPEMDVMDAGLRDNFGMETSLRYLNNFQSWMLANCSNIIFLQIRDTRESEPVRPMDSTLSLADMLTNPLFVIQRKWSAFQTFTQTYLQNESYDDYPKGRFYKILLEFEPRKNEKAVALNFHLSSQDKKELRQAIFMPDNQKSFQKLNQLIQSSDTLRHLPLSK